MERISTLLSNRWAKASRTKKTTSWKELFTRRTICGIHRQGTSAIQLWKWPRKRLTFIASDWKKETKKNTCVLICMWDTFQSKKRPQMLPRALRTLPRATRLRRVPVCSNLLCFYNCQKGTVCSQIELTTQQGPSFASTRIATKGKRFFFCNDRRTIIHTPL